MTKEEYQKLLLSDYWKGYSYSLIKERNFTCEDCGKRFYNERNKLQVHHLVYRDVNPWSYNPDEVVVLCEECHRKRHGLAFESEQPTTYAQTPFDECGKNYTFSTNKENERAFVNRFKSNHSDYLLELEPKSRFKFRYVLYGLLLFVCIIINQGVFNEQKQLDNERPSYENKEQTTEEVTDKTYDELKEVVSEKTKSSEEMKALGTTKKNVPEAITTTPYVPVSSATKETDQIVSSGANDDKVKEKPSQELTTLEILERRNHEDAVRRAQRAGVSTEGSTIDILERINHAEVVKRARRAGVSTEGSTIDILERINHAEVVKRAKRMGISTEGSTIEILERINRKEMEKYNY